MACKEGVEREQSISALFHQKDPSPFEQLHAVHRSISFVLLGVVVHESISCENEASSLFQPGISACKCKCVVAAVFL